LAVAVAGQAQSGLIILNKCERGRRRRLGARSDYENGEAKNRQDGDT